MTRFSSKLLAVLAVVFGIGAVANGQLFDPNYEPLCWDPDDDSPRSDDWGVNFISNQLFGVQLGGSGSVEFGGQCWPPDGGTVELAGRIGFTIGSIGSIQDDNAGAPVDNFLRLQYGMPQATGASWGYAVFVDQEGNKTAFGENDIDNFWVGASNRYMYADTVNDDVRIRLQIDLVGDAARLQWTLQSTDPAATPERWALWFGQWVTMRGAYRVSPATFVEVPGNRPIRIGTRWNRDTTAGEFPAYANFTMNQEDAYGLKILNGPSDETTDSSGVNSDQSEVQELVIANAGFLLGDGSVFTNDMNMPDTFIPDTLFVRDHPSFPGDPKRRLATTGYIQKFRERQIPAANMPPASVEPTWIAYYKSTTGQSNYSLPYAAVVDAPRLVQLNPNNPNQFLSNPATVRVWVDNVGGFGAIDREIPLEGVKVTLTLPEGMFEYNAQDPNPLNPQNPNRTMVRFINRVEARSIGFTDFRIATGPNTSGSLEYSVKIEPAAAIRSKTIRGRITVATQPRLLVRGGTSNSSGANLVSLPWIFENNGWEAILSQPGQPMRLDQDFRAFTWDALNQQYIPQTGPQRERGTWIISRKDLGYIQLGGNPQQPTDMFRGASLLTLRSGWNLIGNPYPYAFPLTQINGVAGAVGDRTNTFQELVDQGLISGSLAWWDPEAQVYKFIDINEKMVPNRGYWIFVTTPQDVILSFPPVYEPFLKIPPGTIVPSTWVQSDKQWRLQIAARNEKMVDDQNYVGLVKNATELKRQRAVDPPVAPVDDAISVHINDMLNGKEARLAGAYTDKVGRQEWTVVVNSKDEGKVTVTWPNLSTLPKNLRLRLTDVATGATRDMRRSSGYTFTSDKPEVSRTFKVQIEPGVVTATKIGSVVVTRDGRGSSSSVNVQYTLTGGATTTVRILGTDGREIYVPARGRAEGSGSHSVVWNLRDAANRSVAPGNYRVEIVAETENGERVRKVVPVVVIR